MTSQSTYCLFFTVLLCSGCALLQRTTKNSEETKFKLNANSHVKTLTDSASSRDSVHLTLSRNSEIGTYSVRLWPKGKISYSPKLGFTGNFDSLQVTGAYQKKSTAADKTQLKQADKTHQEKEESQHESLKKSGNRVSVKKVTDWILVFAALIFAAFALRFVKKRFFS
jgi:hypothetical protein